jgi:hypothetical protein
MLAVLSVTAAEWERSFRERIARGEKPDEFRPQIKRKATYGAKPVVWASWMTQVPPPKHNNRRGRGPDA